MIDSPEGGPFLLEADQGDAISGYMGRDEVADVILAALAMPEVRTAARSMHEETGPDNSRGRLG